MTKDNELNELHKQIIEDFIDLNGLDSIVDKQPKFNLNKINSKEVLAALSSNDMKLRKKAVSSLFEAYRDRYLEIGQEIDDSVQRNPFESTWDAYSKFMGREVPSDEEKATQLEARRAAALKDIFKSLEKDKTKPASEKEIGVWLDDYVKKYANEEIDKNRYSEVHWGMPPEWVYDMAEKYHAENDLIITDVLINKAYGRKVALPDNESLDLFYTRQQYRDDYILSRETENYEDILIGGYDEDIFSDQAMLEGFCEAEEINDELRIEYAEKEIESLYEWKHSVFSIKIKNDKNEVAYIGGTFQENGQGEDTVNWVFDAFKTEDEFRKCFESDDLSDLSDEEILKRFLKKKINDE